MCFRAQVVYGRLGGESRVDVLQGGDFPVDLALACCIDLDGDVAVVPQISAQPGGRGGSVAELADDLVGAGAGFEDLSDAG